jgi:hypothetical protein
MKGRAVRAMDNEDETRERLVAVDGKRARAGAVTVTDFDPAISLVLSPQVSQWSPALHCWLPCRCLPQIMLSVLLDCRNPCPCSQICLCCVLP